MIIQKMTIENFRCYGGKIEVNFNQDSSMNLFYGLSGFGKSSFLQSLMWILYDAPSFGPNDDKPLYNISTFNNKNPGDLISVYGKIDFIHLGLNYCLIRKNTYKVGITTNNTTLQNKNVILQFLKNGNWENYNGDVADKINSILPQALAKYFIIDGERAREIVTSPSGLRPAIRELFGLNAYARAIKHIGTKGRSNSVIGKLSAEMIRKMPKGVSTNANPIALQERLTLAQRVIEKYEAEQDKLIEEVEELTKEKERLISSIGGENNQDKLKKEIKDNNNLIKSLESDLTKNKKKIGSFMYKVFPYMILTDTTARTSEILKVKNKEFASDSQLVFENLHKSLLNEILEKNQCVCGRCLDDNSKTIINNIIKVMPPDSYTYRFNQFVSKAKNNIEYSIEKLPDYDTLMNDISRIEGNIINLENKNEEILKRITELNNAQSTYDRINEISSEIKQKRNNISECEKKIGENRSTYKLANQTLSKLTAASDVSKEYMYKIEFFENLKDILEEEQKNKEKEIKDLLNKCVREVYSKLTTQTNVDPESINFIKDDFTLRETFLAGGQQAVDVYSYVLGLIKALELYNPGQGRYETPVFIDAPFAFTDEIQSEHLFEQLPNIAKQTVLLTLDVNKIKKKIDDDYEIFIIQNPSGNCSSIERGVLDDIKF